MERTTSNDRRKKRKQRRIVRLLLLCVVATGFFFIGRVTKPVEKETVTKIVTKKVEVPAYTTDKLPSDTEITYLDIPLSKNLQKYVNEICADENVPVSLVYALIEQESQFNPETVSKTNDYGLMQINEINLDSLEEQYRTADLLNPYQNVFCGIKIIGSYIKEYETYQKALMAYNMGKYGASKAWQNGITSTNYSDNVLSLMEEYEEELSNGNDTDSKS